MTVLAFLRIIFDGLFSQMFDGVIKDRLAIDNITLFDLLFGVSDGFGLAG